MTDTQNDTSELELGHRVALALYGEPNNDLIWKFGNRQKALDYLKENHQVKKVLALIAQREQAAELRGVRRERKANAEFYREKLKPINDQLDHDIKAMEQATKPEKES